MWPTISPTWTRSPFRKREGRAMCEYQYQRRSRRPLMTMKFLSSLGSNARLDHDAGAGRGKRRPAACRDVELLVPAAAVALSPNSPTAPRVPCGALDREEMPAHEDAPGLLFVSARNLDHRAVGPVRHQTAGVVEAVPGRDLLSVPGCTPGSSIRLTSSPTAGDRDLDRHVPGRARSGTRSHLPSWPV